MFFFPNVGRRAFALCQALVHGSHRLRAERAVVLAAVSVALREFDDVLCRKPLCVSWALLVQ